MIEYYYEKEVKTLNKHRLKYLVVGGIAVNLHGLNRLTRDLDLMIDINEENLAKFIFLMDKLGYGSKVSIDDWKGKVAIAFRHNKIENKQIDVFMKNPIDFKKAYKKRAIFKIGKTKVSCVGLLDLIKMKEIANRDRDWIDIGYLKKYKQEGRI